jgi:hypothetical protein
MGAHGHGSLKNDTEVRRPRAEDDGNSQPIFNVPTRRQ